MILKHAFRNALIPIITLFASFLPAMLGGSVLIEYLFGIPGMGRLSWESILAERHPHADGDGLSRGDPGDAEHPA